MQQIRNGGVKNMFVYVVIAVILIINVINPRILWYIDSWKYRDAKKEEPSSLYLLLCRILSLLGLIILVTQTSHIGFAYAP